MRFPSWEGNCKYHCRITLHFSTTIQLSVESVEFNKKTITLAPHTPIFGQLIFHDFNIVELIPRWKGFNWTLEDVDMSRQISTRLEEVHDVDYMRFFSWMESIASSDSHS